MKIYLQVIGFGQGGVHGLDWSGSGQGLLAGPCECSDELSGSIKYGNSLTS